MKSRIITAILMASISTISIAQPHRQMISSNKGLVVPQDPSSLPTSRAEIVFPEVEPYQAQPVNLVPVAHGTWAIRDGWTLMSGDTFVAGQGDKYNAVVPGTVLTTLVKRGVYPDPYFGVNNMVIPESLCRQDWWYMADLPLSQEQLSSKKVELLFKGINYMADVWVNGTKAGSIRGAFVRGRFDITALAKAENKIAVHIYPPFNPGIPHEQSSVSGRGPNGGQLCLDGPTFISSEGWDWVPGIRDRNIGLWQDVELIVSDGVLLGDTQVITDLPLPSTEYADVIVKSSVAAPSARKVKVVAEVAGEKVEKALELAAGENEFELALRMQKPALWMPNGYGEQNLYTLKMEVLDGTETLDLQQIRFGVREFSYELSVDTPTRQGLRIEYDPTDMRAHGAIFNNRMQRRVEGETEIPSLRKGVSENILKTIPQDEMGPYLVIRCNGVRIFCRGGNWGMDDGMKDCSREKMEPYLQLHKDAGFNMVRNWTGESTDEMFYELCDEYGMLVWNDFWMSTEGYNLDPNDEDLFMENVVDVLKRFRNHPSIAIWCPRNEGYATESLETRLDDAVAMYDGTRRYHPNSRYSNLRTSGPWHYLVNPAEYYTGRAFGFNTELGTPSFPTAETMRKFLAPEDQWPMSEAWYYHDMHFDTAPYFADMAKKYGKGESLDDFCRKAQMMNYDSHRAMLESWNSRMWANTSGILLWMTHPAWPSVEWQVYSWDYETMASFFGCKKACEPVHIQMNLDDLDVVVLNTTVEEKSALKAEMALYTLEGKKLSSVTHKLAQLPANALTECFQADLSAGKGVYIVRLSLKDAKNKVLSQNDYLRSEDGSFRAMDSSKIHLTAKWNKDGSFTVKNPAKVAAIGIKLNARYLSDGTAVLPAFFSDGYVNLLPGESRTFTVSYTAKGRSRVGISVDGYNVENEIILK
ncbi:MAG: glycoside hydrolase family 2 [Bacteroidales bacterium]|nr:glycoside hydrolase family 2 [Bacteroidales bacterium]